MRRRNHLLGLGLLFAAATSVPALALAEPNSTQYPPCTKTVSSTESDLAHQKYIAGKQDYDEGNYDSALRRFRDAYNIDCQKHELLIIISAAHERKGDKKEALNALELYVNRNPNAPDIGTYTAKIDNLKKQIAATPPPTATATTPSAGSGPPPGGEMQEHTPYPWILVGVGGAAVVAGIVIMLTKPALPTGCDENTETCASLGPSDTKADLEKRQDEAGRSIAQPKIGAGIAVGGGLLVGGGLIWHFLEPTGPRTSRTSKTKIRPTVAPGFAGLSVGGTF